MLERPLLENDETIIYNLVKSCCAKTVITRWTLIFVSADAGMCAEGRWEMGEMGERRKKGVCGMVGAYRKE